MEQDRLLQICSEDVAEKTLPYVALKNVPNNVLGLMRNVGDVRVHGGIRVVYVKDKQHYGTISRMVHFIHTGEYKPFAKDSSISFGVARAGEKPTVFDHDKHMADSSFATTEQTHQHFVEEAKLYACSVATEWNNLQMHSSYKIRHSYPVFAAEIISLLGELANRNGGAMSLRDDKMREFIVDRVRVCEAALVSNGSFLELLRRDMPPKHELDVLVRCAEAPIVHAVVEELRKCLTEEEQAKALLEDLISSQLGKGTADPTRATAQTTSPANKNGVADNLAKTIHGEEHWLVALQDGYGTLHVDSSGQMLNGKRNEDFRFVEGELLQKVEPWFYVHSKTKSIVLTNIKGEFGEVFKDLRFRPVQEVILRGNESCRARGGSHWSGQPSGDQARLDPRGLKRAASDEHQHTNHGQSRSR